ncbi:Ribosomal RNA processing protein 1 [Phytophthora palmivora]|uniref:Ribosomal RNA processing protein 1 n=1 Tax=Phytophthora palmivora TaxID=4796 RepID=A0A2P4Y0J0_9STRA|nr:Ribosomal RNA processing protein 1 [Phytophthora palmivora]
MENAASRFGQHLAHTEKKYRDRALKKLTVYLTKKKEWTDLEWDKLWKALFYCMWMSDKRPVQEELSSNLAGLVHRIPDSTLALEFVHSFFRTMHREWHGLDGLRLDKFYSLVRKFVRETVALLRVQDWDEELVQEFVTILSAEVVSQLPNGLRMHLADLYLTEIYNAAGKDVTTEAFITLLEPFFTLLSSEYDKTVFKRVRELVFDDMLTKYKFGSQPEKDEEEEETDEEEENKVFEQVEVVQVQHRIFAIASADDTAERNRSALYTLYKKFFSVTQVDSFQAAQEEAKKPKKVAKAVKKEKKPAIETVTESTKEEENASEKKSKKSKKRKAKKETEAEVEVQKDEEAKDAKEEITSPKKSKKRKAKKEVEPEVEMKKVEEVKEKKDELTSSTKKAKKQKITAAVAKADDLENTKATKKNPVEKSPIKEQPKTKQDKTEKKKDSYVTVTKSGKKFKRCGSCGGFGKGLVPKDKALCGHCERTQKTQKKKAATASKKRKAEAQAQAAREEQEQAESSKKVTFGKSKALRHEVSVKRLKASAKRDAVTKDTEDIKGVLKVTTPSPVASKKSKKTKASKGRKTAADFF